MNIRSRIAVWFLAALLGGGGAAASEADHREFDATLYAPFQGADGAARPFTLAFEYPLVARLQTVTWRLELNGPDGKLARQWQGAEPLLRGPVSVPVRWDGRLNGAAAPPGIYHVMLRASARAADSVPLETDIVEQGWDIAVGAIATPALPVLRTVSRHGADMAPALGALPYTVYLGNLHSQTSHSDGGGALDSCVGAQDPQSAALGPTDAYDYARERGLDILLTSEHNHMYDGSDGTNAAASPATGKALFQSGLRAAADFNDAHPDFLALYGLEWGVIASGGHLNIFNSAELLGWERNGAGELLADTFTAKSDYAALYTLMRERGLVGQFNHPSRGGQFVVNGRPMGFSDDGDQAMALCEVVNSNAFSANTTETETRRSNYEFACNRALEAGFHVAFSTNQDNHCANWGASFSNRTGVLVAAGTALSPASFLDALRARRVFATMDKGSQLVLTANGHLMGERFSNSGPLTLVARFASTAGKTVSAVSVFEGVPGRNGSVTELSSTAETSITPAPGEHFYYVRLTQSDGNMLWSAPVWVSQK
ncbi:MAG: carbohydrate-binding protein CenC [Massilia sp.]|nr:carbohydrate-binding protein CenC [Massilia sp.]